ncbi:hypothetical protein KSP40_PGU000175 [Platanthera guangdongensis]|uniref:Uncharacterized protein n=1 Tax=Platanthera guangdongensis TaxID=2320717 RepID=A0ABR2LH82_9ASPA
MLDCSVDILSMLHKHNPIQVKVKNHPSIRIPRQIREPLLHEMEEYISGLVGSNVGFEGSVLGDLINICSLLCNFIYSSLLARLREEKGVYYNKLLNYTVTLIDHITYLIDENCHEVRQHDSISNGCVFDGSGYTLSTLQNFISGPLFLLLKDKKHIDEDLLGVLQSAENLLAALGRTFIVFSSVKISFYSGQEAQDLQPPAFQESNSSVDGTVRIIDMDLDAEDGSRDTDSFISAKSNSLPTYSCIVQHKLALVFLISTFSYVSPVVTWKTLFDLLGKEDDAKINSLRAIFEKNARSKHSCEGILTCLRMLLETLLSRCTILENNNDGQLTEDMTLEEVSLFSHLIF